ncbi:MAG TPA: hypothetical protein VF746_12450 [Longimicrobium sp.]|jgi:hypothetical protein
MEHAPTADPYDWRTWPRDGRRLFPPPGAANAQIFAGMCAFSAARWGFDPDRPRKDRRNIIRVLNKVDGRYVQVNFGRLVNGREIDIRVRGGCRVHPGRA